MGNEWAKKPLENQYFDGLDKICECCYNDAIIL